MSHLSGTKFISLLGAQTEEVQGVYESDDKNTSSREGKEAEWHSGSEVFPEKS